MLMTFNIKVLLIIFFSLSYMGFATAHNKVVVIPMAGDDVPAELTPSSPIAKVNPNQSDYIIGALTVIDKITGLEWQRLDDGVNRNWFDAFDYCDELDLDSHTDWRLPGIKELQSIVDYGSATFPIIDSVAFPNSSSSFWAAENRASGSSFALQIQLSGFFGLGGFHTSARTRTLFSFARCVR